ALAVGLGALFPSFESENLAQVPTGYGGLVFMVTASMVIIVLIALSGWPLINLMQIAEHARGTWTRGNIFLTLALWSLVITIFGFLIVYPMKKGCQALMETDEVPVRKKSV
ncbi:MAG: putative ABC transporter permease subunit, partial [Candidatus Adiutrix sp.]